MVRGMDTELDLATASRETLLAVIAELKGCPIAATGCGLGGSFEHTGLVWHAG